jgi:hypothetical protein
MQIHELTRHRVDEGFLDDIKAAGQTIKKGYQQGGVAGALKAGTSNQAYAQAKQDVAAPEIARQTAGLAQKYAQEWQTQSVNLVSAEKKSAQAPAVGQPAVQQPAVPAPKMSDLPSTVHQATADNPNQVDQQPYVQTRSGYGPGSQSTQFAKHSQSATAQAEKGIGAMTRQGAGATPVPAANPTAATKPGVRMGKVPVAEPTAEPISIGGQKLNPKNPKDAELLAKLQGKLHEAFDDLPGDKPAPGGRVDPKVTAPVPTATAPKNPLATAYSKAFQKWASDKLTTKERTTNQNIDLNYLFQHIPSSKRTLDQLTATVYNTRKDPNANTQAVTNYMTTAMKFIQQVASEIRKTAPVTNAQKVIASTGDPAKDQLLKKDGWTVTL